MPLHLRPVGPLPASVYWRRRAAVAAGLVLLLVLLATCGGEDAEPRALGQAGPPATGTPAGPPLPSATASAGAAPGVAPLTSALPGAPAPLPTGAGTPGAVTPGAVTPGPGGVAAAPCPDAVLRVSATPDRQDYAAGARPVLRLAVRNGGSTSCTRALGSGAVELLVFSGSDRIWSSDDCTPGGEEGPALLRPQELKVITVTWSGRRSRPGCPRGGEAIERGTYRVIGRVGALRTAGTSFLAG